MKLFTGTKTHFITKTENVQKFEQETPVKYVIFYTGEYGSNWEHFFSINHKAIGRRLKITEFREVKDL